MTPNPDVMCNKLIKFGCFEQHVGRHFDFTATGHYATTVLQRWKTWLGTAIDPVKDQTQFSAQMNYLQVSKLMFPVGADDEAGSTRYCFETVPDCQCQKERQSGNLFSWEDKL